MSKVQLHDFAKTKEKGLPLKKKGKNVAKAKLGSSARFKALKIKLAAKGATDPGALSAWIGRKKYGKAKFQKLAAKEKVQHPALGALAKVKGAKSGMK